jgi:hypothetical protein
MLWVDPWLTPFFTPEDKRTFDRRTGELRLKAPVLLVLTRYQNACPEKEI